MSIMVLFYVSGFKIFAQGFNFQSEWGIGPRKQSASYVELLEMSTLVADPMDIHYCGPKIFVKSGGTVYASGENEKDCLGLNRPERDKVSELQPLLFPGLDEDDYIDIVSNGSGHGPKHSIFISKKAGTVYVVGDNEYNQLPAHSEHSQIAKLTPISMSIHDKIFGNDRIVKVECGMYSLHTM